MQKKRQKLIDFLQKLSCFKGMKKTAIDKYSNFLIPIKYTRGQTVYKQGNPADHVYIVRKGEFELEKRLPRKGVAHDNSLNASRMLGERFKFDNILAKRLPEI